MTNLLDDLQWRGIIYQETDAEGMKEVLEKEKDFIILRSRPDSG